MSEGIRLPTLYPMPRDQKQYWAMYELSFEEFTVEEYLAELEQKIRKEDGGAYSTPMLAKLVGNMLSKGFIESKGSGGKGGEDRIGPLTRSQYSHSRGWKKGTRIWDHSDDKEGFGLYVREALLRWGYVFPAGLELVYDILTELENGPLTSRELQQKLANDKDSRDKKKAIKTSKYDGYDKHKSRTFGEIIKLLGFADWVEMKTGSRKITITKKGKRDRAKIRKRDLGHQFRYLNSRLDLATAAKSENKDQRIFSEDDLVRFSKYFMYRQSGGLKPEAQFLRTIHKKIFKHRYEGTMRVLVQKVLKKSFNRRKKIRDEIVRMMPPDSGVTMRVLWPIGKLKLERCLKLLEDGSPDADDRVIEEILSEKKTFDRKVLASLKHEGLDYSLRPGMKPHKWQDEAVEEWVKNNRVGVFAVVTGAGKTVAAFMAIRELLDDEAKACISILVPTKVLMYQWTEDLTKIFGVPPEDIGLRGDGHKDSFAEGRKIVISIVNSAVKDDRLKKDVERLDEDEPHLLIADECHRYRGAEFRKALEVRQDYSLGLSATPPDPDIESQGDHEERIIIDKLGPIVKRYSYQEALKAKIIQPFVVKYIGVDLTENERAEYDRWTKRIRKSMEKIRQRYGPRLDAMLGSFFANLNTILKSDDHPDPAIGRYLEAVRKRKEMVFKAKNRKWAYLDIIREHTRAEENHKIIVFHERIENLEEIIAPTDHRDISIDKYDWDAEGGDKRKGAIRERETKDVDVEIEKLLWRATTKPGIYHSKNTSPVSNQNAVEWFRQGIFNVLLSVKALVEGVDVPAANIGIIRASSSSVRQRIQTTGRILRKSGSEHQKAQLYVIYVRDTTDERIFRDLDWAEQLGNSAVEYYRWSDNSGEPSQSKLGDNLEETEQPEPEFYEEEPEPEFDVNDLTPGDPYPGRYAGAEYHVDAKGRPFKKTRSGRRFIANDEVKLGAQLILRLKRGGKFVLRPDNHMVTRVGSDLIFVGVLSEDLELEEVSDALAFVSSDRPPTFEELFGQKKD